MAIMKNPILVVATLASVVTAQSSSIIDIFFPGAESTSLIGSIITSDASQTTIAVSCPTDSSNSCGFSKPITVTVGPSTFHAQESFQGITAILQCSLSGRSSASCAETYIGPAYLIESDLDLMTASDATTDTAIITTATSTTLSGTQIVFIPVTLVNDLGGAAEAGAGATTSTVSQTSTSSTGTTATTPTTGATTDTTASGTTTAASPTRGTNGADASPISSGTSTGGPSSDLSNSSPSGSGSSISGGAIGGIVAGVVVGLVALGALWWYFRRRKAAQSHSTADQTSSSTPAGYQYEKPELQGSPVDEQQPRPFSSHTPHQPPPHAELGATTTEPTYPRPQDLAELPGHDQFHQGHSEDVAFHGTNQTTYPRISTT